jgi:hypothetical protein
MSNRGCMFKYSANPLVNQTIEACPSSGILILPIYRVFLSMHASLCTRTSIRRGAENRAPGK